MIRSVMRAPSPPSKSLFLVIFLGASLGFSSMTTANVLAQKKLSYNPLCPLNFDSLRKMVKSGPNDCDFLDIQSECQKIFAGIRVVRSEYLQTTGYFSPPPSSSEACWDSLQILVTEHLEGFHVRSTCGVQTSWISNSCKNIATRSEFEALIPKPVLQKASSSCNGSMGDTSACEPCLASLLSIQKAYFLSPEIGSVSDCMGYPYIYAAAFINRFGPTDLGTAKCFFSLDLSSFAASTKKHVFLVWGVAIGCIIGVAGAVAVVWFLLRWHNTRRKKQSSSKIAAKGLGLYSERTSLIKFTLDQMKEASMNFSRGNLIGKGGYGNVYKGVLPNGSEVALKRFKNCAVSGDENFTHEVEVIASVKHVNLVALRGYCIELDPLGGHQRIIVCDLMKNGSLYDHLFGLGATKLSWPIRRKIALGTAHGLAYLHNGAQPAIIHRDVKTSNILLDETFEPKLADFGLAKFTPDGLSHLSTKVAGTLGYIAPEYALYGQLTERTDVYSFGIVLLELLSGKQAVLSVENGQPLLLKDWAWSLVRKGQPLDVIDKLMPEMALPEVMEKYVVVAVLSTHPMLYARPTMEQIVKMLETDFTMISSSPELNDIDRSLCCTGLGTSVYPFDQLGSISGRNCSSLDQMGDGESLLALDV